MSNVSVDAKDSALNAPQQDNTRRRFLTVATSVVGAVGVAGAAVPFVTSWNPSAKAKAAGADIEVDIENDVAVVMMMMVTMKVMPVMMTVLFYQFPSGLVLYWMVSNVLGIAHQSYVGHKLRAAA